MEKEVREEIKIEINRMKVIIDEERKELKTHMEDMKKENNIYMEEMREMKELVKTK